MNRKTCSGKDPQEKTVFSCSGAADLGEISDLVARKLHADGTRKMKCLAFVSAGIEKMIDSVRDTNMLVIDGCDLDCGRLTMERNGLSNFSHFRLTDLGFNKGQTPASIDIVNSISEQAKTLGN